MNSTLEIISSFVLIIAICLGYFLCEFVNKKTNLLMKIHWIIYVLASFLILVILAIPLIILKMNFIFIILIACTPCVFFFGVSTSMILAHYRLKQQQKDKLKEHYRKIEEKENKRKQKKKQKRN